MLLCFLCLLYFSCGSYLSAFPDPSASIHALVVSQDCLPDIFAVRLYAERVRASAVLHLEHIGVTSTMSLPAGIVLASKTSLSLRQGSARYFRSSSLCVYSGKVRWSSCIQNYFQNI